MTAAKARWARWRRQGSTPEFSKRIVRAAHCATKRRRLARLWGHGVSCNEMFRLEKLNSLLAAVSTSSAAQSSAAQAEPIVHQILSSRPSLSSIDVHYPSKYCVAGPGSIAWPAGCGARGLSALSACFAFFSGIGLERRSEPRESLPICTSPPTLS